MAFHSKMIKLRKIRHMSQEDFAKEIGVSRQSVYKWESGQSYPEVERLLKIARAFGVTVDDMLNDELDINRKGEAVPVEEVAREEAEILRKRQERRERKLARQQEKKEQEAALLSTAEASAAETPAEEGAPVAEEIPAAEQTPAAEETPVEEEVPADPEEPKKKKGGLFGWFRR